MTHSELEQLGYVIRTGEQQTTVLLNKGDWPFLTVVSSVRWRFKPNGKKHYINYMSKDEAIRQCVILAQTDYVKRRLMK